MSEPTPFAVQPLEAIDYLRNKLRVPTATWADIWQDMHARAFVVAGAQTEALLSDFHRAVTRAIEQGRTLEQFRADFDTIVAAHGWSYRGSRGWRSAVIFNTNLRMAYAAGKWKRIQDVKAQRPWLRYVAVLDDRTRHLHRQWHGTILPVDHPWWDQAFPPNGWGCRCTIQQLSDRDLTRLGLKPSAEPPPMPVIQQPVSSAHGKVMIAVPRGIDPGFAYNPGRAAFGGLSRIAPETHGSWRPLASPLPAPAVRDELPTDQPRAAPLGYEPQGEVALRSLLQTILGGNEAIYTDPAGARIVIGDGLLQHLLDDPTRQTGRVRYLPLLPELITDPAEIWIGWAAGPDGKVSMRRRYVKVVDLGGGRILGLVCDAEGHVWNGLTFFIGRKSKSLAIRNGHLVWKR